MNQETMNDDDEFNVKEFVDNLLMIEYSIDKDELRIVKTRDAMERNRKLAFDKSTDIYIPLMWLPTEELAEESLPKVRESLSVVQFVEETILKPDDPFSRKGH